MGKTELDVSLVSFGSGGPSKLGQNTGLSSNEQNDLIRNVLDSGINLIDSSEGYGESEAILGRALLGAQRDSYILATKCLYKSPEGGMRRPGDLKLSIDRCLERLSTDYIDIMQFHVLNSSDYFQVVDELYPVMNILPPSAFVTVDVFPVMNMSPPLALVTVEVAPDIHTLPALEEMVFA